MIEIGLPLAYAPGRVRHGMAVDARPEADTLYEAILALRRWGRTVYRSGAGHKVDGAIITTQDLLRLHDCLGKRSLPEAQERRPTVQRRRPSSLAGQLSLFAWE